MSKNYKGLFKTLSESLDSFIQEVRKQNLKYMTTEEWTVKDMLCHITFWHMYYAKNYSSLANGAKPYVFKGSSTRNKDGVNQLRHTSFPNLLLKLNFAQKSLYKSIVIKKGSGNVLYNRTHLSNGCLFRNDCQTYSKTHNSGKKSKKNLTNYPD